MIVCVPVSPAEEARIAALNLPDRVWRIRLDPHEEREIAAPLVELAQHRYLQALDLDRDARAWDRVQAIPGTDPHPQR